MRPISAIRFRSCKIPKLNRQPRYRAKANRRQAQSAASGGTDANAAASENEQTASLGHKPNELVGLSADQVTNLLGKPSFVRHDMPAEVWQYRAHDCVLDVFLYPPVKSGGDKEHTVLYYELRSKNAQKISGEGCYGALISATRDSS